MSRNGDRLAIGDVQGKVTILKFANNEFEKGQEHFLGAGRIEKILWAPEDKYIVFEGENKGMLGACNPDSGSRVGEIAGISGNTLCGVLTDKKTLYSAGEGLEILKHTFPYKGQGTPVKHPFSGFINQMALSPDGSKIAVVGADKSICIFNTEDD